MTYRLFWSVLALAIVAADRVAADSPVASKRTLSDSFNRRELVESDSMNPWRVPIGGFSIRDGVLHGEELPDAGHGAVARWEVPFRDASITFRFRLTGSKQFNFVIDDKNCKEAHAGHIIRVVFHESVLRLGDDREGIMRNDIFAMRRAKKTTPEIDAWLKARGRSIKNKIPQRQWHTAQIAVRGDELAVTINGGETYKLSSPGIAHPTKTKFGFTVPGGGADFDDVEIQVLK